MRKLLATLLVLFGCLTFVGQAVASSTAGYVDCCLHGCKGMAQCANAACQTCAAPQPALLGDAGMPTAAAQTNWRASEAAFDAGPRQQPWTPPD